MVKIMSSYNQLTNNLTTLKLDKMVEMLPSIISQGCNNQLSLVDALVALTEAEIKFKDDRARKVNISVSSFPYVKTIKDFDFTYQAQINKAQIEDLCSLRFLNDKSNVVFIGSPGVGKTHLATAIGVEAASQRLATYFINFSTLMQKIKKGIAENREEQVVKHYLKYSLLIIDEIGYLPIDKDTSYVFFQLIAARYEKRSTIITTNQPFAKWGEVFGDSVIASAIIDRLVHHCSVIKITGNSYRIKGKNIFEEKEF
jgi:DNA replication protein DnaC